MKILLIGEYSNVHNTLAEGLRKLGHKVVVASNGDFWKNYPRDIDFSRNPGFAGTLRFAAQLITALPHLRGYDVVQIINPMFLELKAEKILPIYRYLRRNNGKVVMGAYGMDYYWVHENITRMPLRYSDFNIGDHLRTDDDAMKERADWLNTPKGRFNQYVAQDCDAIVAGLYEYWACYQPLFPQKTVFIPYPIKQNRQENDVDSQTHLPLKIFIGISKNRSAYKGTDIMLDAARKLKQKYPKKVTLSIACGVPFQKYTQMMNDADVILDQLYSYTPAMNGLEAMSRGIICVGGGEPENYDILGEERLRPIINTEPNEKSVYNALEQLISHPEMITALKEQSILYIRKHHDYLQVARRYENLYQELIENPKE